MPLSPCLGLRISQALAKLPPPLSALPVPHSAENFILPDPLDIPPAFKAYPEPETPLCLGHCLWLHVMFSWEFPVGLVVRTWCFHTFNAVARV